MPPRFVLYGGTALALRLGHRQSIDFDFFGRETFEPGHLLDQLPFLRDATIVQQAPSTLGVVVDRDGPVRLSFFGVPGIVRLRSPDVAEDIGLNVASLLDLAGTKASVVQQRAEAKDYLDIHAILADGRIDLPTALAAARAIYGAQFNPLPTLKALAYFADGDLRTLPAATKRHLARVAGGVDPERLPVVTPLEGTNEDGAA